MKLPVALILTVFVVGGCAISGGGFNTESDVEAWTAKLRPGLTMDEVRRELGEPYDRQRYPNLGESVLSWFYVEHGPRHMFFNAHFDSSTGRLKHTSRTIDPAWSATQGDGDARP